ncbi:hypothetical protein SJI19_16890 [Acerihabitans sp. TG2]|uniref:hypothetical protein n=1 Tax=Acerihabitans sp. TG2 TaxID=3096008 RepID=UPI002B23A371|nr:hypothetical protein [Acerihabitans sp. TG2]MEA9392203.1 hypothetical protein [Acerihabitans sp. TG2]
MTTIRNKLIICPVVVAFFSPSFSYAASWLSVTELVNTMQQGMSAIAVATKQAAVAANQQSLAVANSLKTLSTARGAMQMSNRVVDAYTNFDASTGQASSNGCQAHMQNSYAIQASELSSKNQLVLMQNYATRRYTAQSEADAERLSIHHDTYCSASEATAGACELKANGMQAWDSDYAGAFNQETLSPEAELAGYAYVSNITDERIATSQDCTSAACQSATLAQMQSSAINSMVANSLIGQLTDRRIPEIEAVK